MSRINPQISQMVADTRDEQTHAINRRDNGNSSADYC
jgi:hypothetical protein